MSIHEDLKAYVDGELSPERMEEVGRAVAADPGLAKEAEMLREIGSHVKGMAGDVEVIGQDRAIMAVKSRTRPWGLRGLPLSLQLGFAGVTVAVLAVILFPVFAQQRDAARQASLALPRSNPEVNGDPTLGGTTGTTGTIGGANEEPASPGLSQKDEDGARIAGEPKAKGRIRAFSRAPASPQEGAQAPSVEQPSAAQKIIKTAELVLGVKDAHGALTKAIRIAKGLGGFAESSNASTYREGLPEATVTLRVPEQHFETAVQRIKEIDPKANILQDSVNGEDVTSQYVDTESKLKTLRAAENRYRAIMGQTKKIGEVLNVQERLDQVRTEIEGLEAQRRLLSKQSALSTIAVTFQQRPEAGQLQQSTNWPEDTWSGAVNGLLGVLRSLAVAAMYLFVFAPIWLPAAIVMALLFRRALRS